MLKSRLITTSLVSSLAATTVNLIASLPAQAISIFFSLNGTWEDSNFESIATGSFSNNGATYTYTDSASGLTATVTEYNVTSGGSLQNSTKVSNTNPLDELGIPMAGIPDTTVGNLFKISFNQPVLIQSYIVSQVQDPTSWLDVADTSPASDSNIFNTGAGGGLGTFSFNDQPLSLGANQVAIISASNFTNPETEKYVNYIQGLNVEPVPFESDVLPLLGATALFAGGVWWKRRRGGSQLDLTAPGSDQEPGQE